MQEKHQQLGDDILDSTSAPSTDIYAERRTFMPVFLLDLAVTLIIFAFTILLQVDVIEPNTHGFFTSDISIYNPRTPGRVSTIALGIYGVGLPLVTVIFFGIRDGAFKSKPRMRFFLHQIVNLAFILVVNVFITNALKTMVGRHRPDFISRCVPDYTTVKPDLISGYVPIEACTGSKKEILEGHKSFPSGHASQALVGSVYVAIYLYRRICALFQGRVITQTFRFTAGLIPITAGLVIAASRFIDNRHHALDIICGVIIGTLSAMLLLAYGPLHYPTGNGTIDESEIAPIDLNCYRKQLGYSENTTTIRSTQINSPDGTIPYRLEISSQDTPSHNPNFPTFSS